MKVAILICIATILVACNSPENLISSNTASSSSTAEIKMSPIIESDTCYVAEADSIMIGFCRTTDSNVKFTQLFDSCQLSLQPTAICNGYEGIFDSSNIVISPNWSKVALTMGDILDHSIYGIR
jgi:hypothetical protein